MEEFVLREFYEYLEERMFKATTASFAKPPSAPKTPSVKVTMTTPFNIGGLNKHAGDVSFKTPNGKYPADQVNKTAKEMKELIAEGKKVNGYPKEGSGYPKSKKEKDPTKGQGKSWHAPIKPEGSKNDGKPGPDRVVLNIKEGSTRADSYITHHDSKNPIPDGSKNHPFSAAKRKKGGPNKKERKQ